MKNILLILVISFLFGGCVVETNESIETDEVMVGEDTSVDEESANGFLYINDRFKFQIELLPNFDVLYLPEDMGFIMTRPAEYEVIVDGDPVTEIYTVEIGMEVLLNEDGYRNLGEYLAAEYDGFTKEFSDKGVYVNEGIPTAGETVDEQNGTDMSVRHFFAMNDVDGFIYRAYLKVPSIHYVKHAEWFDKFTETIELF